MLDFPIKISKNSLSCSDVDGIIYVSSQLSRSAGLSPISSVLRSHEQIDEAFPSEISILPVNLPAGRLVYSPVFKLTDYDDVRTFSEAAAKGMKRALKAGIKDPLLVLPSNERFPECQIVTLLGALEELYVPIQLREEVQEKKCKVKSLTVWCEEENILPELVKLAEILETGRIVCRDIAGGDPERMAPLRVEEYVRKLFVNSNVKMEVVSDVNVFEKEYPLFAAVNRAASVIERHHGRIIYLRYEPEGEITRTLGVVGKGITFDTGGSDIKISSGMLGMSRDKCGAAAVAGFMKIVSTLKPKNVRIIGALCLARNSVGENGYVCDEVLTARSKIRVRVNNTDAEGRMVMADVLCKVGARKGREVKEEVQTYRNAHLLTIATLTNHAELSVGDYSIVIDNSVARRTGNCLKLQEAGISMGDPFEVSILRPEDFARHKGTWEGDDVNQSPNFSKSRGHQGPAAFLIVTSGLDKHEASSTNPISYSHLDIAGSSGRPPREPTAASVLALYSAYIKNSI